MPELPEVETVARDLRPRLVGATIVGARTNWVRTLRSQDPIGFADGVAGRTVLSVDRRAKQLVVGLSGDTALTIHLKMTGQLFVVPADRPEDPYIRLVLELADGRELRFRDIRKFGKIGLYGRDPVNGELVEEEGGSAVFAAVGPEPLDPEFTLRDFRNLIRRRKGRLKPLLTDQSFLAGVGNIYADEALWRARLHGARPTEKLTRAQGRAVLTAAAEVMDEALAQGGTSFDALYVNVNGASGYFDRSLAAYGQADRPCPRCGTPIRREPFMNRGSFSCPRCQPRPRAARVS
jgi:formamidopyrimidine-DNA glycosylase